MAKKRGNQDGTFFQRKNGTWCGQVMIDNKRYTVYGKGVQECKKKLRDKIKEKKENNTSNEMFSSFYPKVIEEQLSTKKIRPISARTKIQGCRCFVDVVGDFPIKDISLSILSLYSSTKMAEGIKRKTIKTVLINILSIFNVAKDKGLISDVPKLAKVPIGPILKNTKALPSIEEIKEVIESFKGYAKTFMYILLYTGLRGNEAICLKWSDINLDRCQITVNRSFSYVDKKVILSPPKSNRVGEYVQFSESLKEILLKYREESPGEDLFPYQKHPCTLISLRHRLSAKLKKKGYEGSLHILRHLHASLLMKNGIDLKTIQNQLRHKDISTTNNYLHSLEEEFREDIYKLNF